MCSYVHVHAHAACWNYARVCTCRLHWHCPLPGPTVLPLLVWILEGLCWSWPLGTTQHGIERRLEFARRPSPPRLPRQALPGPSPGPRPREALHSHGPPSHPQSGFTRGSRPSRRHRRVTQVLAARVRCFHPVPSPAHRHRGRICVALTRRHSPGKLSEVTSNAGSGGADATAAILTGHQPASCQSSTWSPAASDSWKRSGHGGGTGRDQRIR